MKNAAVKSIPWSKVGLAVLPGIWLMAQMKTEFTDSVSRELGSFALTVSIALGLVLISFFANRRLMPWSLPALGALLWKAWYTQRWLAYARRVGWLTLLSESELSFLDNFLPGSLAVNILQWLTWMLTAFLAGCVVIASGLVLYWVYRRLRSSMTPMGWGLLCLLFASLLISDYILALPNRWYVTAGLLNMLISLPILLAPVVVVLALSRHDGLNAGLFALACEPLLIDVFINPSGPIRDLLARAYDSSNSGLELALFVLSYLSFFSFLIFIPVGLLRSRSVKTQSGWLTLPSLVTLIIINLIRGIALSGTTFEYSLLDWLRYAFLITQLWIPMLLIMVLYNSNQTRQAKQVAS